MTSRNTIAISMVLCVAVALTSTVASCAQLPGKLEPTKQGATLPRLDIKMQETRLANGLRVITLEDHSAPVITVALTYDVGSANEQKGRTGFAHLFEHLMFQGSTNVEPGQHSNMIERYGGAANATTGTDWTLYFETVPANQLDLALYLESDRLRSLNITQENLAREKEVVKEERRMRFDNQPYRKGATVLDELLYDSFAYAHDGVGSMEDLDAASLEDVRNFFDTYYRPSNLVLMLVGDFDAKTALGRVKHYFDDLPDRPDPPQADRTELPQKGDRRRVVEDPLAPLPQLRFAFKTVPGDHPDQYALNVLSAVLQEGHSSRLHEALVKRRELVTQVSGSSEERRGAGALYVTATVRSQDSLEEVEQTIYREIGRLQTEAVADWEMTKATNSIAAGYLGSMHRGLIRSFLIGAYVVDFDDPNRINTYLDRIASVTKADVQRVANTHLRKGNRTVVVTLPKQAQESAK